MLELLRVGGELQRGLEGLARGVVVRGGEVLGAGVVALQGLVDELGRAATAQRDRGEANGAKHQRRGERAKVQRAPLGVGQKAERPERHERNAAARDHRLRLRPLARRLPHLHAGRHRLHHRRERRLRGLQLRHRGLHLRLHLLRLHVALLRRRRVARLLIAHLRRRVGRRGHHRRGRRRGHHRRGRRRRGRHLLLRARRRVLEAQEGVPDLDLIAIDQQGVGDALAVDHGAVGRAHVLHAVAVRLQVDLNMAARDGDIGDDQHLIGAAAD